MAGCEKITQAPMMPTMDEIITGTSQLAAEAGVALTSSKTSPGIANTFSIRAHKDIAGGLGAADNRGSGVWGDGSVEFTLGFIADAISLRHYKTLPECES